MNLYSFLIAEDGLGVSQIPNVHAIIVPLPSVITALIENWHIYIY